MVGELSPDGQFMWDGTQWIPSNTPMMQQVVAPGMQQAIAPGMQQAIAPGMQHVAPATLQQPFMQQQIPGDHGAAMWMTGDQMNASGGKGKLVIISIVGLLVAAGGGWGAYEFVIDPMLDPDPYSRTQFVEHALAQPTQEEVMNGEVDGWSCDVEIEISEVEDEFLGSFSLEMDTELSASDSAALAEVDMKIVSDGFPMPVSMDVWLSENEVAWRSMDESSKAEFTSLEGEPADILFNDEDAMFVDTIPFCFLHHEIAAEIQDDSSIDFSSEAERFPDEEGQRAVKVSLDHSIDGEDISVSMYFDSDNNLIGGKASNSSGMKLLMTIGTDSPMKPSWVNKAESVGMPLYLESDYWANNTHGNYTVQTQFNATYGMNGAEVILYSEEYDDVTYEDIRTKAVGVDIGAASSPSGASVSITDDYGTSECTFYYNDVAPLNEISTGDSIEMECEGEAYLWDYDLGLANDDGIAQEVDMNLPWTSFELMMVAFFIAAIAFSRKQR